MKVYELMEKLSKCPAGARVFVATVKPIEELLDDNASGDNDVADISFLVKNVAGSGGDVVLEF
jgi:hypothetical protein